MSSGSKKPIKRVVAPKPLPPQLSPTDTSNWDDRTFISPDGKVHIESDSDMVTKPAHTTHAVLSQQSAEPRKQVRRVRLVMANDKLAPNAIDGATMKKTYLKFKDLLSRTTGVSMPVAGLSWQPSKSELATAKTVINFLEDRRVLYNPTELEVPHHCIASIIEIRHFLTQAIDGLGDQCELKRNLRVMRGACRKFLDSSPEPNDTRYASYSAWVFYSNLGELRGTFGLCLKDIALSCSLDVEQELASIIPLED